METRIRLRHLRCFQAIAQHKSLTRAAEALNTVQPALSRSLRELEEELGQPLFHRTAQGMVLTPQGQDFLQHIEGPLSQIGDGIARLKGDAEQSEIRISMAPAITRRLGVEAIAEFSRLHPDVRITIEARMYTQILPNLRDGSVDFAVGRLVDTRALGGLSYEQLFVEPIIFAAHRNHPLASRRNVTMREIDEFLVLGPERGATIWGDIDKFLMKNGKREFRQVLMSSSYDFSRAYMRRTEAIACLSRSIMGPELESGEFVQLDIPVDDMLGSVGITYRTGTRMAPHVRALFDLFRDKARDLPP